MTDKNHLRIAARCFVAIVFSASITAMAAGKDGALVIVGGGGTPDDVVRTMVELAGGTDAKIIIAPQASKTSDGSGSVEMFRSIGAKNAHILDLKDREDAVAKLSDADLLWFPGGQQSLLVDSLQAADLTDLIRQRHAHGIVIGGTSAGAAAMSAVMIPTAPKKQMLIAGNTPTTEGLGLAPEWIIDQHFVRRSRMNRLLGAVLDHPDRVGVGIGEQTAIVCNDTRLTVMGKGSVIVIDARAATGVGGKPGAIQSAQGIRMHVLKDGDQFRLQ